MMSPVLGQIAVGKIGSVDFHRHRIARITGPSSRAGVEDVAAGGSLWPADVRGRDAIMKVSVRNDAGKCETPRCLHRFEAHLRRARDRQKLADLETAAGPSISSSPAAFPERTDLRAVPRRRVYGMSTG